jgi:hypothetical protein
LARFDAVVFMRMSCADMARPETWKMESGPFGIAYSPFSARVMVEMRPFRNDRVV